MNKERLIELLSIPYSELAENKTLQNEILDFYKFIYDVKTCTSCKNKFQKYYDKLMIDGIEKMTIKIDTNFKLRNDIGVLQINFGELFISQYYAPDDVCIGFLKANPNRISLFEKYPANWKELIQNNDDENDSE